METVLNRIVSCFANYGTPDNPQTVNMLTWLTSDKHYAWQQQIAAIEDKDRRNLEKAKLPCITPSGLFTYRAEASLIKHSGLLQFDIDWKENQHVGNYDQLNTIICSSPQVAYCGRSVSGTGYWGLIPLEIATVQMHKAYFRFIKWYFAQHGITIDEKPANVASLRGYSYDPDAYFNHAAQPLTRYLEETPAPKRERVPVDDYQLTGSYDDDCFAWCLSVHDRNHQFASGSRNHYITALANMLNDFGVSRPFVESELVSRFAEPGFPEREILATIKSIYSGKARQHAIKQYEPRIDTEMPKQLTYKSHGNEEKAESVKPETALLIAAFEAENPESQLLAQEPTKLFAAGVSYADVEIDSIAKAHGSDFQTVIKLFDYLGRCASNETGQLHYFYRLKPEFTNLSKDWDDTDEIPGYQQRKEAFEQSSTIKLNQAA